MLFICRCLKQYMNGIIIIFFRCFSNKFPIHSCNFHLRWKFSCKIKVSYMETLSRFYNYKCLNTEWYTNFDSYCQWLTFFFEFISCFMFIQGLSYWWISSEVQTSCCYYADDNEQFRSQSSPSKLIYYIQNGAAVSEWQSCHGGTGLHIDNSEVKP